MAEPETLTHDVEELALEYAGVVLAVDAGGAIGARGAGTRDAADALQHMYQQSRKRATKVWHTQPDCLNRQDIYRHADELTGPDSRHDVSTC